MSKIKKTLDSVTILFAGDSGDGIQLAGGQFTNNTAFYGNDLSTLPDFPAEIRAPIGTLAGVSGFQINFGSKVFTPGDYCDFLVAMNAASLKKNINKLRERGIIVLNTSGFDKRNIRLAKIPDSDDPFDNFDLKNFIVHKIDITKLTREILKNTDLEKKEIDRCKNMFVLGFIYWIFNRSINSTVTFLEQKFFNKKNILNANISVLKAGYNYGDTSETFSSRFDVKPRKMKKGSYRNILGNQAICLALVSASYKSKLDLFYSGYPITPASDILHQLSKYKSFGVRTFQAEDEISAICSAIGASFGGNLAVTASSGPGMALKTEALGLVFMLELPLIIINVQRGGPSTGLPTKTEQSDLLQAVYGRNGEAPIPVFAPSSPSDCFLVTYNACKIALKFMTPVIILSDGYIANGAEPWKYPVLTDLDDFEYEFEKSKFSEKFNPYLRNENFVRNWAIPGTKDLEHTIGGLEKDNNSGDVSYEPENHQLMVKIRQAKVNNISNFIPDQKFSSGSKKSDMIIISWGSTYGVIQSSINELKKNGYDIAHIHINYIVPLPKNIEEILKYFEIILVPEINNGQLIKIIRDKFLVNAIPLNKIMGIPFNSHEIVNKVKSLLN